MTRWCVFAEQRIGYVDGHDKEAALVMAHRQFGGAVLRVQSARSLQLEEEERRTAERERLRGEGW